MIGFPYDSNIKVPQQQPSMMVLDFVIIVVQSTSNRSQHDMGYYLGFYIPLFPKNLGLDTSNETFYASFL